MNEAVRRIIFRVVALLVAGAMGFGGGYFVRSGDVERAMGYLRDAEAHSQRLEQRLTESQSTVEALEGLEEGRQRRIRDLKERLQRAIERARARDEIIAGLEDEIKRVSGRAARIGELAERGQRIVESLRETED